MAVMITKEQVISLLLDGCPSFAKKWREHQAFYAEDQSLYIDLGEFAHHILDLYKRNQTQEFPAVFNVIERLYTEGDDYVKEAATIGLLEGIQNIAENKAEVFVLYLRPESAKRWKKLNDFWSGKVTERDNL